MQKGISPQNLQAPYPKSPDSVGPREIFIEPTEESERDDFILRDDFFLNNYYPDIYFQVSLFCETINLSSEKRYKEKITLEKDAEILGIC